MYHLLYLYLDLIVLLCSLPFLRVDYPLLIHSLLLPYSSFPFIFQGAFQPTAGTKGTKSSGCC